MKYEKNIAIRKLATFLSGSALEVLEACGANKMGTGAHVYYKTWPVVLNALFQRLLTGKMLQKANNVVTRAPQKLE